MSDLGTITAKVFSIGIMPMPAAMNAQVTGSEGVIGSGIKLSQLEYLSGNTALTYAQLATVDIQGEISGTTVNGLTPVPYSLVLLMFRDQLVPLMATRSDSNAIYSFTKLDRNRSDYVVVAIPPEGSGLNIVALDRLTPVL